MAKTYRRETYDRFERKKKVEGKKNRNARDFYSSHTSHMRERFTQLNDVVNDRGEVTGEVF